MSLIKLTESKLSFVSVITFAWHKQSPESKSRTVEMIAIFSKTSPRSRTELSNLKEQPAFERPADYQYSAEGMVPSCAHGGLLWFCLLFSVVRSWLKFKATPKARVHFPFRSTQVHNAQKKFRWDWSKRKDVPQKGRYKNFSKIQKIMIR